MKAVLYTTMKPQLATMYRRLALWWGPKLILLTAHLMDFLRHKGIIEVKCLLTARIALVSPQSVPYLQQGPEGLTLQSSHQYYCQVMGTLFCTGREWCDFVVWTYKDMKIIRIPRDNDFIADMLVKLHEFYDNFFRKALLKMYFYWNSHEISILN